MEFGLNEAILIFNLEECDEDDRCYTLEVDEKDKILDITAIDNLPSLLPRESSEDFAAQLLPHLMMLKEIEKGVWGKACAIFNEYISRTNAAKSQS